MRRVPSITDNHAFVTIPDVLKRTPPAMLSCCSMSIRCGSVTFNPLAYLPLAVCADKSSGHCSVNWRGRKRPGNAAALAVTGAYVNRRFGRHRHRARACAAVLYDRCPHGCNNAVFACAMPPTQSKRTGRILPSAPHVMHVVDPPLIVHLAWACRRPLAQVRESIGGAMSLQHSHIC
jgi:hypothetical protein